ncbi:MAG: putative porin [Bacteroidaceae bacterium]|nr:putative porin [Bacteroidaceae bacterium]
MPRHFSILTAILVLLCFASSAKGQVNLRTAGEAGNNTSTNNSRTAEKRGSDRFMNVTDTTEVEIPIGQFQWCIEPRLGTVIDAENTDTAVHNFQNFNLTEGYTGQYNFLGNLGAPRLNRIFLNREQTDDLLFLQPFSYFRDALGDFRFTNTLSPITNLAYHKCGSSENGQDRVRAYFASNINKAAGIGFKLDYLFGRGYYNNQANSQFGGTVYGYYRGDKYNAHAYINVNHMKMGENGGIEDDRYIEDPQSFQQSYSSKDIPVTLSDTWNRNHEQTFYLSHRYNVGIYRDIELPDSLKPKPPSASDLLFQLPDSVRMVLRKDSVARAAAIDSLTAEWASQQVTPQEFLPVTSFIHTMQLHRLKHDYLSHRTPTDYYTNHYYGSWNDVRDETRALQLRNTLGIALREGFNKWAQSGISLYGSHRLNTYTLPFIATTDSTYNHKYVENDLSLGGTLSRMQGEWFHYNVDGEFWLAGPKVGDFNIDGQSDQHLPLGQKDTLDIDLHAYLHHQKANFYLRHYHSQATWWDNGDLNRELRTRIMGTIGLRRTKTRLTVGMENMTNYTYFAMQNTLKDGASATSTLTSDYTHDVALKQEGGNVQVFSATLAQDLKLGPLHWDSEVTYQKTSKADVLPLPDLSLYTNLYLLFRIARVLRVQVGGDMRYFTSYYAPDYAPSICQFATQDTRFARTKIGNYPIINVYANMHLKHCRLYLAVNHVNEGDGHAFWAPHYPIDPFTFHFGLSWNFFN